MKQVRKRREKERRNEKKSESVKARIIFFSSALSCGFNRHLFTCYEKNITFLWWPIENERKKNLICKESYVG